MSSLRIDLSFNTVTPLYETKKMKKMSHEILAIKVG